MKRTMSVQTDIVGNTVVSIIELSPTEPVYREQQDIEIAHAKCHKGSHLVFVLI